MRIYNLADVVRCSDCAVVYNVASDDGGGCDILGRSTATFVNCSFRGNEAAKYGGAFFVNAWGEVYVKGCTVGGLGSGDANRAKGKDDKGYGGGVLIRNAYGSLSEGTQVIGNEAQEGGGFDVWGMERDSDSLFTIDCKLAMDSSVTVSRNYASRHGGAGSIVTRPSEGLWTLTMIVDPQLDATGSLFEYNVADGTMSGIRTSGLFFGDEADGNLGGGATFQHHLGAAITCANAERGVTGQSGVTVSHCIIRDNAVGVLCDGNPDAVEITHSHFWRNGEGTPKAHIVIEGLDGSSDVDITYCEFLSTGTTYGVRAARSYYATLTDDVVVIANNNFTGFVVGSDKWAVRAMAANEDGTIKAEHNYWGHANGPYLAPGDPLTASRVSAGVDYTPFCSVPVEGAGN